MSDAIIFYDGVCGFCNRFVQFVLARDAAGQFRFASIQSDFAREALTPFGRDPSVIDTFYLLVDPETPGARLLDRSSAAVEVLARMGSGWRAFATLARLVPTPLRDAIYGFVAARRYRIMGRYDSCLMPSPEQRARFIEV